MEIIKNSIHTDLSLIKEFRDETISAIEDMDYDDELIFKIKLILDELIINSYKHGNNKDYEKMIEILILFNKNLCMIKVRDEGEGINYSKHRDQFADHGRGIQLVYNLSDNLIVQDNTIAAFIDCKNKKA